MHRKYYFLLLFGVLSLTGKAQNYAELKGTVIDTVDSAPVIGATVRLLQNNVFVVGAITDISGSYYLSGFGAGEYVIEVSMMGYGTQQRRVKLQAGEINYQDFRLGTSAIHIDGATITGNRLYDTVIKVPPGANNPIIPKVVLIHTSTRGTNERMNTLPGTNLTRGGLSIKGARPSATAYYLGTMPMISRLNISAHSLAQMGLQLGGVAPEYGDFTGGAVVQYLTPVSTRRYVNAEYITSSLFDKYHYNQFDLNFGGPLIMRKEKGADYERMVLGYHSNFNLLWQADPFPSAIGVWHVKPDKLKYLEANPILPSRTGTGFAPAAEFLRMSDLEKSSARKNAAASDLMWIGKLEYRPRTNILIEVASIVDRQQQVIAPWSNELLNAASNPVQTNWNLISFVNMEHNLLVKLDTSVISRNKLKRLKYSISVQYQGSWSRTEDPNLGEDYFRYGYIGRFDAWRAPVYVYKGEEGINGKPASYIENGDTIWVNAYYEQSGFRDTLVVFDRSNTANPLLANYTSAYFNLVDHVSDFNQISGSGGGLLNGVGPQGIYSNMWSNTGALAVGASINSGVSRSQTEQFSVNVNGELHKGIHSVKLGLYFEQRVSRGYSVNATNLWTLMYQSANQGLVLDLANPIVHRDANGVFADTISYRQVFNGTESEFARRVRQRLIEQGYRDVYGNAMDANSYVNVHELDPDDLSLDLFTADELLGTGGNGQYVSYYGYDYLGKKDRGSYSVQDFLNSPGKRSIGAFRPVYAAMYVQDMIEVRNMIIRMGVRVERFDANSVVLRDPYSLYPIRTAGEVTELNGQTVDHPDGIGSDYKVYVDNAKNPGKILGYRDGHNWYDASGLRINDPNQIAIETNTGTIQPYLVDGKTERLSAESFRDYDARTLVLPRFSVDFPISEEARFFAYYDVLAQRPSNIFTPIDDYYFLRFNPTQVINNPDLKPQITTDYELGFKQSITRSSLIALTASYREQRNMIQLVRYNQAYPVTYLSYGNIDFATIKGLRAEYALRSLHLYLDASYQFQIAEGTGSGTGSQGALVSAGQPNLRNLFPLDFDSRHSIKLNVFYNFGDSDRYAGPVINGRRIMEHGGIGLNLGAISGAPYTANLEPTADAQSGIADRSPIAGTPNGSRMPWQLNNNINIYRAFPVVMGQRNGKAVDGSITLTLWVENFLNLSNVQAVHAYTGSAGTDGYLNSAKGKAAINASRDAQSFTDLYNAALANPGFYGLPRRTRISVMLTF